VPDRDRSREDQHRQQRVQPGAHEVGHDHHAMAREAVGQHAADQQEAHQREGVGREHEPDVAGRADLRHVQRERHEHDPVAERAGGLPDEHQAEVTVIEQRTHGSPP
jgi:hypothetical protein